MDYSVLSGSPLFSGIPADDIEKYMREASFRIRKYGAGSLIAHSGGKNIRIINRENLSAMTAE